MLGDISHKSFLPEVLFIISLVLFECFVSTFIIQDQGVVCFFSLTIALFVFIMRGGKIPTVRLRHPVVNQNQGIRIARDNCACFVMDASALVADAFLMR